MTRWMRRSLTLSTCALFLSGLGACGVDVTPVVTEKPKVKVGDAQLPPISGGSLLVTRDVEFAVAADADSDRVIVASLRNGALVADIPLKAGDEPGRLVEGAEGEIYVALRRGGAIAWIDLADQSVVRLPACAAPRGLAFDVAENKLHLACAGGELLSYDASSDGPATRVLNLGRDLRDVMVRSDGLLVSQFRSPAVIRIDTAGQEQQRVAPKKFAAVLGDDFPGQDFFAPTVAWRSQLLHDGRVMMVHQRAMVGKVGIHPKPDGGHDQSSSAYGGSNFDCGTPIVHGAVSVLDPDAPSSGDNPAHVNVGGLRGAVLPVDIAISPSSATASLTSEDNVAIAAAGSRVVKVIPRHMLDKSDATSECGRLGTDHVFPAQPISVAYASDAMLLIQTRAPAALWMIALGSDPILLFEFPEQAPRNTGHELFHARASQHSAIACASCHPGGRDDGHSWDFEEIGLRRTQSLVGGLLATLPLHWDGDMDDVDQIMDEVFVGRMGGAVPHPERRAKLASWLDGLRALDRSEPSDLQAVERGKALYEDPVVACSSCHSGTHYTNNKSVDVGTGKALQVPGLVGIADRAPFMHDGCAPDLTARFDESCGGGDAHGKTSHLSQSQIADLIAYLETL